MSRILLILLATATLCFAQAGLKFTTLKTKESVTFVQVEVLEKVADGIYIRHAGGKSPKITTLHENPGITKLPYEALPADVVRKLGGFKAEDAKKFRKQIEADAEEGKSHKLEQGEDFIYYDPKAEAELEKEFKREERKARR